MRFGMAWQDQAYAELSCHFTSIGDTTRLPLLLSGLTFAQFLERIFGAREVDYDGSVSF